MHVFKKAVMSILFFFMIAGTPLAHDKTEEVKTLKSEIAVYQSKIDETRKNTDLMRSKATADSLSYVRYLQESQERSRKLAAERDSLTVLAGFLQNKRDSLIAVAEASALLIDSYKRQTGTALGELRASCRNLTALLEPFAVFNISKQISALRFLDGELSAGTIEATEGLERYWQIVSQIEKSSQKIEMWTAPSPVRSIKGEARFLRLGFVWLACIDNSSTHALLWNPACGVWDSVNHEEQVNAINKAVQLCTGMAAPQLVALPVSLKILPNKKGN
ncbi:MAG: DUF3450 family protein [Chitinispirillaceae bacterium]|nr:DUF3450 family protein [Chitinispirillaceae bacterium]